LDYRDIAEVEDTVVVVVEDRVDWNKVDWNIVWVEEDMNYHKMVLHIFVHLHSNVLLDD
jgi:hypothetical protein